MQCPPQDNTARPRRTPIPASERSLRAQIAANARWAKVDNRTAATAAARAAQTRALEDQVDPDRRLLPAERAKRVENARNAQLQRMALASAKARRQRKAGGVR
jgi:hypothetical protein